MKTDAEKIKEWLVEANSKVQAMKHWYLQNIEKGAVDPSFWNDGPYPPMEKLIALCRELLTDDDFNQIQLKILRAENEKLERELRHALTYIEGLTSYADYGDVTSQSAKAYLSSFLKTRKALEEK